MPESAAPIAVSIVSHGQAAMVRDLLADLAACPAIGQIVVTHNHPEPPIEVPAALSERVEVTRNAQPCGFAANHNAAFRRCDAPFFCVLNPDIRLGADDPFDDLLAALTDERVAVVAPAILDPLGRIEDSVRCFPTPRGLVMKALGIDDGRHVFSLTDDPLDADWLAGMFLLFRSTAFAEAGGFDEGFHLYYEDIDLCTRLHQRGRRVLVCPRATAVHDARRTSRRNPRYAWWHLRSIARYFRKHLRRLPPAQPRRPAHARTPTPPPPTTTDTR